MICLKQMEAEALARSIKRPRIVQPCAGFKESTVTFSTQRPFNRTRPDAPRCLGGSVTSPGPGSGPFHI